MTSDSAEAISSLAGSADGAHKVQSAPTTASDEAILPARGLMGLVAGPTNGMWVWNTTQVLAGGRKNAAALIAAAKAAKVKDLYLYMNPSYYLSDTAAIAAFNKQASRADLRVWALDGDRAYFSDAVGPAKFYQGIDSLVAFNAAQPDASTHFYGFQSDNEPNDTQGYTSFHDDLTDSALSTVSGSGVWQATQAMDREMLMRDWLTIHSTAQAKLHAAGLRFGAAMPSWTSDYYGQELQVNFPDASAVRQGVMKYMMDLVDEYVIMSYNTDPANAAARCLAQVQYASSLPADKRPKVFAGVETHPGVGAKISYADTPGKASRAVVMQDIKAITKTLRSYPAFGGVGIHDWAGWQVLAQ